MSANYYRNQERGRANDWSKEEIDQRRNNQNRCCHSNYNDLLWHQLDYDMWNAQTDRIVLWSDVSVVDCHWYLDGNLSFMERKSAVRPLKYLRTRQNNDQKVLSAKNIKNNGAYWYHCQNPRSHDLVSAPYARGWTYKINCCLSAGKIRPVCTGMNLTGLKLKIQLFVYGIRWERIFNHLLRMPKREWWSRQTSRTFPVRMEKCISGPARPWSDRPVWVFVTSAPSKKRSAS